MNSVKLKWDQASWLAVCLVNQKIMKIVILLIWGKVFLATLIKYTMIFMHQESICIAFIHYIELVSWFGQRCYYCSGIIAIAIWFESLSLIYLCYHWAKVVNALFFVIWRITNIENHTRTNWLNWSERNSVLSVAAWIQ